MNSFFGRKGELDKFASRSEIVIPSLVIDEIKERYRRDFVKEKDKFFKTLLPNVLTHNAGEIDIEEIIADLIGTEKNPYSVIELTEAKYLFEITALALRKKPPFVPVDGSDKGFKDAYIYFTVLEYLQKIPDKYVFFVTGDDLLKKAFSKHSNIKVIDGFNQFTKAILDKYKTEYFIDKLKDEVDSSINIENVSDSWSNIDDNDILSIKISDDTTVVEIDSGEIISHANISDYIKYIDKLVSSTSFEAAADSSESLNPYISFFADGEVMKILTGTVKNPNIHGAIENHETVKQLVSCLYEKRGDNLPDDYSEALKSLLE